MTAAEAKEQAQRRDSWEHQYNEIQDEIFLASLRGSFDYSTFLDLEEETRRNLISDGFSLEDKQEFSHGIDGRKYILIKW